ncbi:MAG TPA: flippase [Candidatus Aenigmarchaeota archaeon]|nr:flippase [Candidatus Aenigmarchaeota archaeon]
MYSKMDTSEILAKDLAKGGGITFVGIFLGIGLDYLTRIVIARYLGVASYGLINLGLSVLVIATTISLLGLEAGTARFISFYMGQKKFGLIKKVIFSGLKMLIPLSLITMIFLIVFSENITLGVFHEPRLVPVLKIFIWALPFAILSRFLVASLRGFKDMKHMILANEIWGKGSRTIVLLLLLVIGFNILGATFAYLLSFLFTSIISFYYIQAHLKKIKISGWSANSAASAKMSQNLLFFSLPLIIAQMLGIFRSKADTLLLGYFATAQDIGLYNAALPIALVLPMGLHAINRILMPCISELYAQGDIQSVKEAYRTAARWAFYGALPLFFAIILFSQRFITLLFGKEYLPATLPLLILACGSFLNVISGSFGETLIAIGRTKINMILSFSSLISSLILNIWLIPRHGIVGAAVATSISLSLMCFIGMAYLYNQFRLQPFTYNHLIFSFYVIAAFIILYVLTRIFIGQFLNWFLVPFILLSYIISLGGLFVIGGAEEIDRRILKTVAHKARLNVLEFSTLWSGRGRL